MLNSESAPICVETHPPKHCFMFFTGNILCTWLQFTNCIVWVAKAEGDPWSLPGSSIQLLTLRTKQHITYSEMDTTDFSCLLFHLEANRYTITCSVNPINFNKTSISRLSVLIGDDGVFYVESPNRKTLNGSLTQGASNSTASIYCAVFYKRGHLFKFLRWSSANTNCICIQTVEHKHLRSRSRVFLLCVIFYPSVFYLRN